METWLDREVVVHVHTVSQSARIISVQPVRRQQPAAELDVLDGCCLLPGSSTLQPTQCDAYVFSRGAVLMHPRAGAMLLLFDAGLSPRRLNYRPRHFPTLRGLSCHQQQLYLRPKSGASCADSRDLKPPPL